MEQQTPLVVVIPTKNRRVLLERALESVLAQDYPNYRVVIINDGSTDDTHRYLDSTRDPRVHVIYFEQSRGVNVARNAAFKTLREGEWAVPLDDDDALTPNALQIINSKISITTQEIQVLYFNAIEKWPDSETASGYVQAGGWHDYTYDEVMHGIFARDCGTAYKWTLFPAYLFSEDVNGFEGEWQFLVARDHVGIRHYPDITLWIDHAHTGEHLSNVAARRDPGSFVRAHLRIFGAHREYFRKHPSLAFKRAIHALKIAIRTMDLPSAVRFGWYALRAAASILFFRRKSLS